MRTDTIRKPFLLSPPAPTERQILQARSYREKAGESLQRKEESFQRCDTDGFLSQWASGITARECEARAKILENGGYAEGPGLFEGDRVVKAKIFTNQYGTSWLLADEEVSRFGRRFIPVGENSRIQKKLGLREGTIYQPAWAKVSSSGTGLSGCANAYIEIFPVDEVWQG